MPTARHGVGAAVVGDTIYIIGGGVIAGFGSSNVNEGFVYSNVTGIDEIRNEVSSFQLFQNYPNPFNPTTKIICSIPGSEKVLMKVYDVLGKEVKTLLNEYKDAGTYEIEFDGSELSNGIYFYRMQAGKFSDTKKFILLR